MTSFYQDHVLPILNSDLSTDDKIGRLMDLMETHPDQEDGLSEEVLTLQSQE